MATLSLKNRSFYKQVNMEMHNAQRDKLKQMQREMLKVDKQHIKDQLNCLRKVQSQSNMSKKNKEFMAYIQSTMKESSFKVDGEEFNLNYGNNNSDNSVNANMKKIFEEAKALLEK